MPDVLVEVKGAWLGARKGAFLEAIHGALVEALRTPADDKVVRLVEHAAANFLIPHGMSERFVHIEIALFAGRSRETKRALYRALVARVAAFGVPAEAVKVVLLEVAPENVGLRGGQAACDIELGYEVKL